MQNRRVCLAGRLRWRWWSDRVGGTPKGYRPVRRDQPFLLPPDHAVWLVIEAVGRLDTSAAHAHRRTEGAGTAGYDPDLFQLRQRRGDPFSPGRRVGQSPTRQNPDPRR